MRQISRLLFAIAMSICLLPSAAFAYIGPGLGAGALGVVFGVIGAFFLALFAIVYYPVKRFLKRRRTKSAPTEETDETPG